MPDHGTPAFNTIAIHRHAAKGRALYAQKAFAAGEVIETFNPLLLHPSASRKDSVCTYCLKPGTPRSCSRCHCAWYCDAACQAAGWTAIHAKECKKLRTNRVGGRSGADVPAAVRLVLQSLLKTEISDAIDGLEGHVAKRRSQADKLMDLRLMAMAACQLAGVEGQEPPNKAIDTLCKIQANAFHRYDVDLGQVGVFLEPTLAMANHSCLPNALVQFVGRTAVLRAERAICAGQEIEISYTDYTMPLARRQRDLAEYMFVCGCPRCKDDLSVYEAHDTSAAAVEYLSVVNVETHSPSKNTAIAREHCHEPEETPEALDERYKVLKKQLDRCGDLARANLWAVTPLPQVLGELAIYYSERQSYSKALAVAACVATLCDPYRYPTPFHPVRAKNILVIAKLLANTASGQGMEGDTTTRKIEDALREIDQVSLCQMLLLLVLKLGPQGYKDDWELGVSAQELLHDIEELPGRENEQSFIHAWDKQPESDESKAFFQYAVMKQLGTLTELGNGLILNL